jgi:threonine dehydratase
LIHSFSLGRRLDCDLYLKAEMLQRTGSFKLRGAYNMIMQLSPAQRQRGVIAASAGNHAQGVAVAAALAATPAVVVMPTTAPHTKVAASRAYGAEVILHGEHFRDASALAAELQRERGLVLIHGFDAAEIIAGQGTVGAEIMEDLSDLDDIIVPVGGGGLIAGIAVAVKSASPAVRIIGVQAERAPSLIASLSAGEPVTTPVADTIADGIAVERPGDLPFAIIRRYVDDVVVVKEEHIEEAIRLLLQRTKLLAEGAGAAALAAIVGARVRVDGRRVALVLSGGNIDLDVLARVVGQRS